jgi:hypothetical protein
MEFESPGEDGAAKKVPTPAQTRSQAQDEEVDAGGASTEVDLEEGKPTVELLPGPTLYLLPAPPGFGTPEESEAEGAMETSVGQEESLEEAEVGWEGDTAEEDFEEWLPTAQTPPPAPAADTLIPPPPGFGSTDESQDEDDEFPGTRKYLEFEWKTSSEETVVFREIPRPLVALAAQPEPAPEPNPEPESPPQLPTVPSTEMKKEKPKVEKTLKKGKGEGKGKEKAKEKEEPKVEKTKKKEKKEKRRQNTDAISNPSSSGSDSDQERSKKNALVLGFSKVGNWVTSKAQKVGKWLSNKSEFRKGRKVSPGVPTPEIPGELQVTNTSCIL